MVTDRAADFAKSLGPPPEGLTEEQWTFWAWELGKEAAAWYRTGMPWGEASQWQTLHVGPRDAFRYRALGMRPPDIQRVDLEWQNVGFTRAQKVAVLLAGFTPALAAEWRLVESWSRWRPLIDAGLTAHDVLAALKIADEARLPECGANAVQDGHVLRVVLAVRTWRSHGFSDGALREWAFLGDAASARAWRELVSEPVAVSEWLVHFQANDALRWAHIFDDPTVAAAWRQAGVTPEDARHAVADGLSLRECVQRLEDRRLSRVEAARAQAEAEAARAAARDAARERQLRFCPYCGSAGTGRCPCRDDR